ncbi:hypothetical protein LPJ66_002190 [Kickxella alabastrina]|uniref:Uncharacterized protein n=1 Tax=Kickxella alabastrina TaxID=61397 RepID=A0ACC1IRF3_9FUNG|nr:hypothetical protein LPJ66_002190 [Kickxella alabastrina]
MNFEQTLSSLREELSNTVQASDCSEIPWSWIATFSSRTLAEHSTGLSRAVLLAELEAQWHRFSSSEAMHTGVHRSLGILFSRHGNPPLTTCYCLKIDDMRTIDNTNIWLWELSGAPDPLDAGISGNGLKGLKKRNTADTRVGAIIHWRYYPMIEGAEFAGFFGRNRTLMVTTLVLADRGNGFEDQPVHTLLPTTALAFVIRIKDDLNLPSMLLHHTDEHLLHDIFGVAYSNGRFFQSGAPVFNADQVWCKIGEICQSKRVVRNGKQVLHREMYCLFEHMEQSAGAAAATIKINFWDEDAATVDLYNTGDYIGLLCPIVRASSKAKLPTDVDYGTQTIAFIMKEILNQPSTYLSQTRVSRNELGYFDYSRYAHRVQIGRLCPEIISLSLLAQVVAVSNNMPLADDGEASYRYAIRIMDGSGRCDVTLWGELGRQASRLLPGQLVLMDKLDTEDERSKDGSVIISSGADIGSSIINVSTLDGILHSSSLRKYTHLANIPSTGNCYAKGCVVEVTSAGDYLRDPRDRLSATCLIHTACQQRVVCPNRPALATLLENPTDFFAFDCPGCCLENLPAHEVESVFSLRVSIDDGTDVCAAQVTPTAAYRIMRISSQQLLELPSRQEQMDALANPLGKEIVASISSLNSSLTVDGDSVLRIDAACPAEDIGIVSVL